MKNQRNLSIIGATFYGNRGAEAMLSTTIGETYRCAGDISLKFNLFSYYPKQDQRISANADVSIYSSKPMCLVTVLLPCALLYKIFHFCRMNSLKKILPKSILSLAKSDALVCLAGVSFVHGRAKFLPFNVATILPAILLGVPVIKFSQALGPFQGFLNRILAKFFLLRCQKIFTRGNYTHNYVKGLLTRHNNYERADDVAFLFNTQYNFSYTNKLLNDELSQLQEQSKTGRLIIGLCPSVVVAKKAKSAGWDYDKFIINLIIAIVELGFTVAFYPNATRAEEMHALHNNDLPLLERIYQQLPSHISTYVVLFSGSLNARQIYQIINGCDIHIVSRFHAMVAALSCALPVLVIGWSHKYLEVMESFGQADMVLDFKAGELNSVLVSLRKLIDERQARRSVIAAKKPAVLDLAGSQIKYLINFLERSS